MEKAIGFHTAALGFSVGRRLFKGSVAEMLGATSAIHLLPEPAGSIAAPNDRLSREHKRHWTPVHLDFEIEGISTAAERAIRAGAKLEGDARTFPWKRLAAMSAPFFHGFCVLQLLKP